MNRPLLVSDDRKHSAEETRYFALGRTDGARQLAIAFTLRGSLIRVISARPMRRKEGNLYAQAQEA